MKAESHHAKEIDNLKWHAIFDGNICEQSQKRTLDVLQNLVALRATDDGTDHALSIARLGSGGGAHVQFCSLLA
jgi:hypothetical protein